MVDLNLSRSNEQPLTCDVPQGSVLGPWLFSLFINDIAASLTHSNHLIFADDTQIYLSCYPSQIRGALSRIALDASAIARYATDNGLSFNLAESKVLIMGSSRYVSEI